MRLSDGRLMPIRDAPIGGQAVLEGVMMRGVSHLGRGGARARRVARTPPATTAPATAPSMAVSAERRRRRTAPPVRASTRTGEPLGAIEIHRESFVSAIKKRRLLPAAGRARRGRARRVAEDRHEGARHLRQRPARRARRGDLGQDLGLHDRALAASSRSASSSSCRSRSRTSGRTSSATRCSSCWSRS